MESQSTNAPVKRKLAGDSSSAATAKVARKNCGAGRQDRTTILSTRIRHKAWKDNVAFAVLLASRRRSNQLAFPIVRQRIAVFLLQVGVKKQFVACVALGIAWRLTRWPTTLQVEHLYPMSEWRGVERIENGYLKRLDLSNNELTGPIPTQIGQLWQLNTLELQDNELSGPIPSQIGQLSQLTLLDLSNNKFSGPIPSQIGQLSQLEGLYLSLNQLSGPLPTELGQQTSMQHLWLNDNKFSGTEEFKNSIAESIAGCWVVV